jgi:hypothetical protein
VLAYLGADVNEFNEFVREQRNAYNCSLLWLV